MLSYYFRLVFKNAFTCLTIDVENTHAWPAVPIGVILHLRMAYATASLSVFKRLATWPVVRSSFIVLFPIEFILLEVILIYLTAWSKCKTTLVYVCVAKCINR